MYGVLRCISCILTLVEKQALFLSASIVKQRRNSCILRNECHIHVTSESTSKANSNTILVFHISVLNSTNLDETNNVYLTYDSCILDPLCLSVLLYSVHIIYMTPNSL